MIEFNGLLAFALALVQGDPGFICIAYGAFKLVGDIWGSSIRSGLLKKPQRA